MAKTGGRAAARNMLVALYQRPPQTAEKTRLIADALADIGDINEALALARPNPVTLRSDIRGALSYAGLLVKANRDAEAVSYIAQAESGAVPAEARRDLERLKGEIAARRSDRLRERGDLAGAWDQISALLAAYPNRPCCSPPAASTPPPVIPKSRCALSMPPIARRRRTSA
jgi:cellulose synthase operon protein C